MSLYQLQDLIRTSSPKRLRAAIAASNLDLAMLWPELEDAERDILLSSGAVLAIADMDVSCGSEQPWTSEWIPDQGFACVEYTLTIQSDGMAAREIDGWHMVGYDGEGAWVILDSAESDCGLPRLDGWHIDPGDNIDNFSFVVPCWRRGDSWVTLDREHLSALLEKAADQADHGEEPDWEKIGPDDRVGKDEDLYVLDDGELVTLTVWHGGVAPLRKLHAESRIRHTDYVAEAWGFVNEDLPETFQSRQFLIHFLRDRYGDVYADLGIAFERLADLFQEKVEHLLPPGMDMVRDDGSIFVHDDDREADLDLDDIKDVWRSGWESFLRREGFITGAAIFQTSRGRVFDDGCSRFTIGQHAYCPIHIDGKSCGSIGPDVLSMIQSAVAERDPATDAILADALEESGLPALLRAASVIRLALEKSSNG